MFIAEDNRSPNDKLPVEIELVNIIQEKVEELEISEDIRLRLSMRMEDFCDDTGLRTFRVIVDAFEHPGTFDVFVDSSYKIRRDKHSEVQDFNNGEIIFYYSDSPHSVRGTIVESISDVIEDFEKTLIEAALKWPC